MTDRERHCLAQLQPYTPYPTQNLYVKNTDGLHELYYRQRREYLNQYVMKKPKATDPVEPKAIPPQPAVAVPKVSRTAMFHKIIDAAAFVSGVKSSDVTSKSRRYNIVIARRLYYYYARETTGASLDAIGKTVGVDHSTVHHGIQRLETDRHLHSKLIDAMDRIFGEARENYRKIKAELDTAREEAQRLKDSLTGEEAYEPLR